MSAFTIHLVRSLGRGKRRPLSDEDATGSLDIAAVQKKFEVPRSHVVTPHLKGGKLFAPLSSKTIGNESGSACAQLQAEVRRTFAVWWRTYIKVLLEAYDRADPSSELGRSVAALRALRGKTVVIHHPLIELNTSILVEPRRFTVAEHGGRGLWSTESLDTAEFGWNCPWLVAYYLLGLDLAKWSERIGDGLTDAPLIYPADAPPACLIAAAPPAGRSGRETAAKKGRTAKNAQGAQAGAGQPVGSASPKAGAHARTWSGRIATCEEQEAGGQELWPRPATLSAAHVTRAELRHQASAVLSAGKEAQAKMAAVVGSVEAELQDCSLRLQAALDAKDRLVAMMTATPAGAVTSPAPTWAPFDWRRGGKTSPATAPLDQQVCKRYCRGGLGVCPYFEEKGRPCRMIHPPLALLQSAKARAQGGCVWTVVTTMLEEERRLGEGASLTGGVENAAASPLGELDPSLSGGRAPGSGPLAGSSQWPVHLAPRDDQQARFGRALEESLEEAIESLARAGGEAGPAATKRPAADPATKKPKRSKKGSAGQEAERALSPVSPEAPLVLEREALLKQRVRYARLPPRHAALASAALER